MEQVISTAVNGVVQPMANLIVLLVDSGVVFFAFLMLWVVFGAALIWSQGSLDAAWAWIWSMPPLVQGLVWLLFLPVVAGLWIWETTWPLILRLILVLGLAWWNIFVFLPRALIGRP